MSPARAVDSQAGSPRARPSGLRPRSGRRPAATRSGGGTRASVDLAARRLARGPEGGPGDHGAGVSGRRAGLEQADDGLARRHRPADQADGRGRRSPGPPRGGDPSAGPGRTRPSPRIGRAGSGRQGRRASARRRAGSVRPRAGPPRRAHRGPGSSGPAAPSRCRGRAVAQDSSGWPGTPPAGGPRLDRAATSPPTGTSGPAAGRPGRPGRVPGNTSASMSVGTFSTSGSRAAAERRYRLLGLVPPAGGLLELAEVDGDDPDHLDMLDDLGLVGRQRLERRERRRLIASASRGPAWARLREGLREAGPMLGDLRQLGDQRLVEGDAPAKQRRRPRGGRRRHPGGRRAGRRPRPRARPCRRGPAGHRHPARPGRSADSRREAADSARAFKTLDSPARWPGTSGNRAASRSWPSCDRRKRSSARSACASRLEHHAQVHLGLGQGLAVFGHVRGAGHELGVGRHGPLGRTARPRRACRRPAAGGPGCCRSAPGPGDTGGRRAPRRSAARRCAIASR